MTKLTEDVDVTAMYAPRRGLRESLESYAARMGYSANFCRAAWRIEGLRLLHVPRYMDANVRVGLCACAPGVAVSTAFVDWPDDLPGATEPDLDPR